MILSMQLSLLNKMKRLLMPILVALSLPTSVEANWSNWFGRYGSFTEAEMACDKWKNGGMNYKIKIPWGTYSRKTRSCKYDKKTRQFLGWEYQNVEENKIYEKESFDRKVAKRFYF